MDGLCITDHDTLKLAPMAQELTDRYGFLILVGVEILTYQGDLLVYGVDSIPSQKMHAPELSRLVREMGGASAAAHPFRDNGRGMGDVMRLCSFMDGAEIFNGSTKPHHNRQAVDMAQELSLATLGGQRLPLGGPARPVRHPIRRAYPVHGRFGSGHKGQGHQPCNLRFKIGAMGKPGATIQGDTDAGGYRLNLLGHLSLPHKGQQSSLKSV